MKLKGINTIEQHVEKVVLVVVVVVFLGVLAMQFLLSPNSVQVGDRTYKPQFAFQPVESKAQEVAAQLRAPSVELPAVESPDLMATFSALLDEKVAPRERIASLGGTTPIEGEQVVAQGGPGGGDRMAQLSAPAPATPLVVTHWATLDPYAVASTEGLASILPAEQPFDLASVVIQTSFDGTALHKALVSDEGGQARPLPPNWWRDSIEILGLEVEREELGADGTWSNATMVQQMPGSVDLVSAARKALSAPDMVKILESARSVAPEIQRPMFYPVIAGPAWITPSEAAAALNVELNRSDAERVLRNRQGYVDRRTQLEEESGEEPDAGDRRAHSEWERAQQQIEQLTKSIEREDEALRALGVDPEVGLPEAPVHNLAAFEPASPALLSEGKLVLWANDVRPDAGATYRYRARVLLNNPAFGRGEALAAEQREMASDQVLAGDWSAWSEPIEVADRMHFFVTSASAGDGLDADAGATAEMFRFYYGYWRRGKVTLDPGDVIAASLELPSAEKLPIYEVKAEAEPGKQVKAEPKPGPTTLSASREAFLLDVAVSSLPAEAGLGSSGRRYQVFLRGDDGQVEIRDPELERESELYRLLSRSAEVGLRQGEPEVKPEQVRERPRLPEREVERPEEFVPGKRGGGGGGGGGG